MTKEPVIFIAGKFFGKTSWEIEQNVRLAESYALTIAKMNMVPICPHSQNRFFFGEIDEKLWLNKTLNMLERCDAIFMIPNWMESRGATVELQFAKELSRTKGMRIFYTIGDLVRFYGEVDPTLVDLKKTDLSHGE